MKLVLRAATLHFIDVATANTTKKLAIPRIARENMLLSTSSNPHTVTIT